MATWAPEEEEEEEEVVVTPPNKLLSGRAWLWAELVVRWWPPRVICTQTQRLTVLLELSGQLVAQLVQAVRPLAMGVEVIWE